MTPKNFKSAPQTEITVLNSYDTRVCNIEYRSDGIFRIQLKKDVHIEIKDSREMFEILKTHSRKPHDMLVLVVSDETTTYDKEVRDFSSSLEASEPTFAEAIVIKSLAQKILINFTIRILRPNRHIKMFTHEDEAIDWLYTLKKEFFE